MIRLPALSLLLPLLLIAVPAHGEERRAMISGFERIRVDGPFEVTVTTGASPAASVTGDPRALDAVTVRVSGTTLVIGVGVNGWGGFPGAARAVPRVAVVAPRLAGATLSGGGTLTIARMEGQRVTVALAGSGRLAVGAIAADRVEGSVIGNGALTLAGRAATARFVSTGSGEIDAAALDVGTLTVAAQGAGEARFSARTSAEVSAQGQGRVSVAGTAACTVRGSAPVVCGVAAGR